MKYPTGILTIIALSAAFVLSGCDTDRQSSQSSQMDSADNSIHQSDRNTGVTDREVDAEVRVYRAANSDRIMEYNRTITEIKEKISNEPDREERVRLERKLEEYEETHRELKREMDNYSHSGRDNWDSFKDSFSERMDDLGDSLDDFFSTDGTATTSRN